MIQDLSLRNKKRYQKSDRSKESVILTDNVSVPKFLGTDVDDFRED